MDEEREESIGSGTRGESEVFGSIKRISTTIEILENILKPIRRLTPPSPEKAEETPITPLVGELRSIEARLVTLLESIRL